MSKQKRVGSIAWTDLTVPDAEAIKDFYRQVVGWEPHPVSMGDYSDFNMISPGSEEPVAGICHARGVNAELPSVWLVYIVVENLEQSLAACRKRGGEVLLEPRGTGPGSAYAVIRDPSGAVSALYQVGD